MNDLTNEELQKEIKMEHIKLYPEESVKNLIVEELEKIKAEIVKEIKDRNSDLNNTDIVVGLSMALAIIQKGENNG